MYESFSVLVGGKAGDGINEAGNLIARLMNRMGYRVYVEVDYPSLIRGGHNFSTVRCAQEKVACRSDAIDVLIALDDNTVAQHKDRVREGGTVIVAAGAVKSVADGEVVHGALVQGVPVSAILKELEAPPVMRNTCLLGALGRVMGIPWRVIESALKHHVPRGLELNLAVARRGYDQTHKRDSLPSLGPPALPVMNGNEAVGLGLLRGGCQAYVAYPMSPSSGLLHFMAQNAERFQLRVVHPENEIAVVLMALGMAYVGVRAAVGTAGGGFCLMTEGVSLAGQAELPIVFMVAQRPGPSTGLPTYTSQADLHFVLNAGQGEFPRLVVAPGDAEQAYYWATVAMRLAWRHQIPAFVLTDKALCEGSFSIDADALPEVPQFVVPLWDGESPYRRYALPALDTDAGGGEDSAAAAEGAATASRSHGPSERLDDRCPPGVSPLGFPPLVGEVVKVDSYEHDESGVTTEDPELTVRMQEKRLRKWEGLEADVAGLEAVQVAGPRDASTALVCWGSNAGVCREVAEELGMRVVQPLVLSPFPSRQMDDALRGAERVICVENNATGQLERLLREHGFAVDDAVRRYDGRSFSVEELVAGAKEVLS